MMKSLGVTRKAFFASPESDGGPYHCLAGPTAQPSTRFDLMHLDTLHAMLNCHRGHQIKHAMRERSLDPELG